MPDADDTEHELAAPPSLDLSHATPKLWAALAEAQAKAHTVGKDGRNRDAGYNYATADSMIRGGARARAEAGAKLALVTTWSQIDLSPPPNAGKPDGPGQWPSAEVTLHWALGCGEDGGYIAGTISTHAIGSRRRPPDKATAAAATYAEGFVERNLMRLDRAEESDDDVDRRTEQDTAGVSEGQQREPLSFQAGKGASTSGAAAGKPVAGKSKGKPETKAQVEQRKIAEVQANVRALYEQLGGKAWQAWSDVCRHANTPKGATNLGELIKVDTYLAACVSEAKRAADAKVAAEQQQDPEDGKAHEDQQPAREREPGEDDDDPGDDVGHFDPSEDPASPGAGEG